MSDQSNGEEVKAPDWMAQLPDDLKGNEYLAQFPKMGEAMNTLLGVKKEYETIKPQSESMKEELEKYKTSSENMIERPDTEESLFNVLQSFVPDDVSEYGVESDDEFIQGFLQAAQSAKATPAQVKEFKNFFDSWQEQQTQKNDENREKALHESQNILEDRWKSDYGKNVELANRGLKTFVSEDVISKEGVEELTKMINETEFGTSPAVMELFSVIGRLAGEDFRIEGDTSREASSTQGLEYPSMKRVK